MATIRKRTGANGRFKYQAIVRKKGHPLTSRSFTRLRDAQRWALETEAEMERGLYFDRSPGQTTTLVEVLERYGNEVTPHKKGWRGETSKLNVLKQAKFAQKAIALVRPEDIAAWRDKRLKDGRSSNTVRNDLVVLSTVFQHAMKELRLVQDNPVRKQRDAAQHLEAWLLGQAAQQSEQALGGGSEEGDGTFHLPPLRITPDDM